MFLLILFHLVDSGTDGFASVLGVTEEDVGIRFEQDRVLHAGISRVSDRSFEDKNLLTLPHAQHWHTVNTAVGHILGGTRNGIGS
jgi:hypothetical protein